MRFRHALPLLVGAMVATLAPLVAPAEAAAAATAPTRPLGIDVSRWQSPGPDNTCAVRGIAWDKVRTTTRSFVMIRATRTHAGVTEPDACFDRNWAGATARGIYRGAYHYAIPSTRAGSAARDARAFVAVAGRMQGAGDLPPVLDLESAGGLKPAQLVAWTATWLSTVRALTGRQPMIYTYPSFWRSAMADSQAFHAYPLWIANWTRTPSVPGGWPTWTIHQYSASGRVAGISGDVDLDVFNGTAAALHAFAHPGTHPTAGTTGPAAYRGSPWRISGHLVSDRKVPVTGSVVKLYRSVGPNGAWKLVASTRTTGTTGYYRFVLRPGAAARYKVRYSGGRWMAASWSTVRGHSIRERSSTRVTTAVSTSRARRGSAVRVTGTLARGSSARLPAKVVTLYQRVGSGRWSVVRSARTTASARYAFTVRPTRATTYRVLFSGSLANRPSASVPRRVSVR